MMTQKQLCSVLLDFGEAMLSCGAEVGRVEDTLSRLASAFGAQKTDVFVITASIVLTVTFPGEDAYTVSRRTTYLGNSDFRKLEALNALSRRCSEFGGQCLEDRSGVCDRSTVNCTKAPMTGEDLRGELEKICKRTMPVWLQYLAAALASGAFAVFFGGRVLDGVICALMGMLVCCGTRYLPVLIPNKTAFYLICAALIGVIIYLVGGIFPSLKVDKIAIGVVMLLIPGITTTNAVRDVLSGETISGSLKLIQCLVWSMMIACGFMMAIRLTGADAGHSATADSLFQLVPAGLGALGFALMFYLPPRYLPAAVLGSMICWGIYLAVEILLGGSVFWCSLVSALAADLMAQLLARVMKTPTTLFLIPLVVPLIPGSSLYYAAAALVAGTMPDFWHYGLNTLLIVFGIAVGIGISANVFSSVSTLLHKKKERRTANLRDLTNSGK